MFHSLPTTRFARVLVEAATQLKLVVGADDVIEVPLTQGELASMAGVSLSTAQKTLATMDRMCLVFVRRCPIAW